ncbi:MAG: PD40 domain-containing protein, partial [Cyclobacteriaceae bacterium]|nr:PD40 domain-containing protein [Cyclobacteriaceae bacterium]
KLTESMDAWDLANMCVVWSGNSKWLAFYATENREDVIYIVSANGGKPVKVDLDQRNIGGYGYRMSLSPDGKLLAFVDCDQNNIPFIYTVPTDGGSPVKLTGSGFREPSFSPDGKFIAIVKIDMKNRLGDEIYVIPATGGIPILISDDAGAVKSPVWSPDGSMIAFLSRKYEQGYNNASNELWIAAIDKKGEPTGLITRTELNNSTLSMLAGWSPENKIGIWLSTPDKTLLYTVPSTGGQAMQVTTKNSWMPSWSPDGKYLYFDGTNTDKLGGLESVPVTGGKVSRSPIKSEYFIQPCMPTGGISISPDGEKIVFVGFYSDIDEPEIQKKLKGTHIMIIPVKGGNPVKLTTNPLSDLSDAYPVWSPDGRNIAFLRLENKTENNKTESFTNIYTIPADGGTPKKVSSVNDKVTYGRIDWSPDGKWVGFFSADKTIKIIPAGGGNSNVVVNDVDAHLHFGLSFSPEGDKITYSNKEKLYVVDLNNGNREEIRTGLNAIPTMPAWSPDGGKITFSAYSEGETDLWFMENFLPLEKLAQNKETEIVKESEGINIKQVWKKPYTDFLGTVSSDGRFRSCVDWGNGDLAIHNVMNGEIRLLTHNATLGDTSHFVLSSAISKNGKQVASSWWNPNNTNDLLLVDVDNLSQHMLYKQEGEEVYPVTWLSDDVFIMLRYIKKAKNTQICSFNIKDGTVQVLKTLDMGWPQISCSPDEKYVAFDFADKTNNGNFDINIIPLDGGNEITIVSHKANDKVLGWVPGRKEFLFISDRSGTWDIWAIPLDEGKASGPVKRIYTDIGEVQPVGFTEKGDCFFGFSRRNFNAYIAPFDVETGELKEKSGKSLLGSNFWVKWSPDGQYLTYIKEDSKADNPWQLTIQDLKTGEERKLGDNLRSARSPSWSPDGNSIIVVGTDNNKFPTEGYRGDVYLVDVKTGETTEVLRLSDYTYNTPEDDASPLSDIQWSSDGKSIFYLFFKDRLVKHDLETGEEKVLFKHTHFNRLVLKRSPDGKNLL